MKNPLLRLLCTASLLASTGASLAQWTPPPPPPPPPQPDLVVTDLTAKTRLSNGDAYNRQKLTVTFYVKNIGGAGAPLPNLRLVMAPDTYIRTASTNPALLCNGDTCTAGNAPPLPPGASILATFILDTPATKGNVTYTALADPLNKASESSETNNGQEVKFTLIGPVPQSTTYPAPYQPATSCSSENHAAGRC
ncbi:MAG TPA: CARDB domain-containing protein [Solimonas sp.]|nr:CARDB domain-containing protein [Solimonas sp.]